MSLRGEAGWKATYKQQYGDRFTKLLPALRAKTRHVCLLNPFLDDDTRRRLISEHGLESTSIPFTYCSKEHEEEGICMNMDDGNEKSPSYFLDAASVIAALAVDAQSGHKVLDMCAAPGGKALVLAAQLFAPSSCKENIEPTQIAAQRESLLVVNEVSPQRAQRLKHTIAAFIPEDIAKPSIRITHSDATASSTTMCRHGPFDRILLDAPCSSDRHLVQRGAVGLRDWSTGTPKASAERQAKLLQNALQCLKMGGIIVYSTCALSPLENDKLVEKVVKKLAKQMVIEKLPLQESLLQAQHQVDVTEWGTMFLPDTSHCGPLFICRLQKTPLGQRDL